jgi:hypothetical protein
MKMAYPTNSHLRATENDLRREFKSLLNDKTLQYAHELAANERAIATLERDFRASERDNSKKIKELEQIVKRCIGAHDRKIDEIECLVRKLAREARRKENEFEDLLKMNGDKESRIRELERR